MTKEEKNAIEAEIVAKFGEPSDPNDEPNEARRRIDAVRQEYRAFNLAKNRAETKANGAKGKGLENQNLGEIAKSIPREKAKEYQQYVSPLDVTEADLAGFEEMEREIVRLKLESWNLTNKQIADRLGCRYQAVTKCFATMAWKVLYTKIADRILPFEALMSLREGVKSGDTKLILEVNRHYGQLQNESLDVTQKSKPIEDPKLVELLKKLGDNLAS